MEFGIRKNSIKERCEKERIKKKARFLFEAAVKDSKNSEILFSTTLSCIEEVKEVPSRIKDCSFSSDSSCLSLNSITNNQPQLNTIMNRVRRPPRKRGDRKDLSNLIKECEYNSHLSLCC